LAKGARSPPSDRNRVSDAARPTPVPSPSPSATARSSPTSFWRWCSPVARPRPAARCATSAPARADARGRPPRRGARRTGPARRCDRDRRGDQRRFDEVDADFARDEGEGDLSLAYWRQAHEAYLWRLLAGHAARMRALGSSTSWTERLPHDLPAHRRLPLRRCTLFGARRAASRQLLPLRRLPPRHRRPASGVRRLHGRARSASTAASCAASRTAR
jgi:hypothetical protein